MQEVQTMSEESGLDFLRVKLLPVSLEATRKSVKQTLGCRDADKDTDESTIPLNWFAYDTYHNCKCVIKKTKIGQLLAAFTREPN